MDWFQVDKDGLAKLLERKGKAWALYELVQNAWDENTTQVDVTLERIPGSRQARLTVRDDNPAGFADLSHAWRLWAESSKKALAEKRGRYNLRLVADVRLPSTECPRMPGAVIDVESRSNEPSRP